ncbi:MAG: type I pullulanase, partial [Lachnospiraceae bacterium]|nr:type I pullulanase [Lachnospiraceae bacterium]
VIEEEQVVFRVWAPTASSVSVRIYPDGDSGEMEAELPMTAGENGVWKAEGEAALVGKYYTYYVTVYGESGETIDPYAKSAGVNGQRGMILDLSKTDPEGFSDDTMPETESATDDVIYEISVRDFTVSDTSGVTNKGKYLGLAETGTVNEYGDSTGLDYLRELGIAYIQLMPTMDFEGIDEENGEGYNWGYNPLSYFVPEGSYATDAKNGEVRIAEYKEMVQALHENGIRVVLDVVYTHTYTYSDSSLNILVPGYYYRFTKDGSLSDGSGCGNETATERAMMRKLIVDSVCYWAEEYHVDGFRFDLMGLIDTETMEAVRIALDEINPEILVYGEGWTGGTSSYEGETASSANASSLLGVSFFNNVYRRGIQAYICGDAGDDGEYVNWVKFGIIGAVYYEELYDTLGYWTSSPDQSIQYSTCHDGYTLYDLIRQNCSNESEDNWIKRNQLASAMVLTGEGIPLFQSGEEFLRSKPGSDGNYYSDSYNAGDEVNALDWNQRTENSDLVEYYREWIAIRKMNDAFGLDSAEAVQEKLSFLDSDGELVIGYDIALRKNLLFIRHTVVIYNAGEETGSVSFYGKTLEAEPLSVAVYTETRADLSACALAAVAGILLLLAVVILIRRGRKRKSILRERVGE